MDSKANWRRLLPEAYRFLIPKLRGAFDTAPIRALVPSNWIAHSNTRHPTHEVLWA
jgi:hypothetical protein